MQSADNATTVIHKRVLCGSGMGSSPSYFSTLGNLTTTCAINVFKVREKRSKFLGRDACTQIVCAWNCQS